MRQAGTQVETNTDTEKETRDLDCWSIKAFKRQGAKSCKQDDALAEGRTPRKTSPTTRQRTIPPHQATGGPGEGSEERSDDGVCVSVAHTTRYLIKRPPKHKAIK